MLNKFCVCAAGFEKCSAGQCVRIWIQRKEKKSEEALFSPSVTSLLKIEFVSPHGQTIFVAFISFLLLSVILNTAYVYVHLMIELKVKFSFHDYVKINVTGFPYEIVII